MSRKHPRWFKHDTDARGDSSFGPLMAKHGFAGYGHYWALVEQAYEDGPLWDLSDEDLRAGVAYAHGWTDAELIGFVDDCCRYGLFDATRWKRRKVLTCDRICSGWDAWSRMSDMGRNGVNRRWHGRDET